MPPLNRDEPNNLIPKIQKLEFKGIGKLYLPEFITAVTRDDNLVMSFLKDDAWEYRWSALNGLARGWPNSDKTPNLLRQHASKDNDEYVKHQALTLLVSRKEWINNSTRDILTHCATDDTSALIRSAALIFLTSHKVWLDRTTKELLTHSALYDKNESVQDTAKKLQIELGLYKEGYNSLNTLAINGDNADVRINAIKKLIPLSEPEKLKEILIDRLQHDKDEKVIRHALSELTENIWKNEALEVLQERIQHEPERPIRHKCIQLIIEFFPDDSTLSFLKITHEKHTDIRTRIYILKYIATTWWERQSIREFVRQEISKLTNEKTKKNLKEHVIELKQKLSGKWENYLINKTSQEKLPEHIKGYPSIRINKCQLRNIGVFQDTGQLNFSSEANLVLGDNATGKSTLLRCLALASIGVDAANEVENNPSAYLRKGTESGSIEVSFHLIPDPDCYPEEYGEFSVGLQIEANSDRFKPLPDEKITLSETKKNGINRLSELRTKSDFSFGLVCAYGSTRIFSDNRYGSEPELPRDENEWVIPIFRWDARITNPYLLSRFVRGDLRNIQGAPKKPAQKWKESISKILEHLLPGIEMNTSGNDDDVKLGATNLKFSELSDGYRSLLTVLGHFIRSQCKLTKWREDATSVHSIAIIDEVDLHLHPTWQKRIIGDLQKAFPNVQFIVSSHSPLVAGALDLSVTHVMSTQNGSSKIHKLDDLIQETHSMKGWRADQILTGPGFNLDTSMSFEAESWEDEYDELLDLQPDKRTDVQNKRLTELSNRLDKEIPRSDETINQRKAAQAFEKWAIERNLSNEIIQETLKLLRDINTGETGE